jgi:hypothetical protein
LFGFSSRLYNIDVNVTEAAGYINNQNAEQTFSQFTSCMQQSLAIASGSVKKRFWFSLALAAFSLALMRLLSNGLSSGIIIEFELAKTAERATQLMNSWSSDDRTHFLRSIYTDFLFIAGYGGFLFYGCRYMGHLSGHPIFQKAGYIFSYLAIAAAACDVIENFGMLYSIRNEVVAWIVHFTYDMAVIKFSLIFILLLFMLICLFFRMIDKLAAKN